MRSVILIIICVFTLLVQAQDPEMRMDPDAWLAAHVTDAELEVLFGDSTAYIVGLHTPDINLRSVRDVRGAFAVREGADLRVVLDATGTNISRSHNVGFNHGCFTFMHEGDLYQLGGMGYWREHADLIRFHPSTGEWEKSPLAGGPRTLGSWNAFHSIADGKVYIIDGQGGQRMEGTLIDRDVWSLDVSMKMWKHEGTINHPLATVFSFGWGPARVDMGDFVMLAHNHQTAVIRKSDLRVLLLGDVSSKDFPFGGAGMMTDGAVVSGRQSFQVKERVEGTWTTTLRGPDFATLFEEKGETEALPLIVPGTAGKVARLESLAEPPVQVETKEAVSLGKLWPLMMALLAFLIGGWFGARRSQSPPRDAGESPVAVSGDGAAGNSGSKKDEQQLVTKLSMLARGLHDLGDVELDTAEFNRMLGLEDVASEESIRAKRANLIRDINREYDLFFQQELIQRRKDPMDKRRTLYLITPHSGLS